MLQIVGTPYTVMADNSRQDKISARKLLYLRRLQETTNINQSLNDESRLYAQISMANIH